MKRHAQPLTLETLEPRLSIQLTTRVDSRKLLGVNSQPIDLMPNAVTIMRLRTKVPMLLVTADTARLGIRI
jgi:hypothetical protein